MLLTPRVEQRASCLTLQRGLVLIQLLRLRLWLRLRDKLFDLFSRSAARGAVPLGGVAAGHR
jgi:hypothetical protein